MLTLATIIGIAAGALSGALAAGKVRMDLIGVVMVGFVTALGGGTLRDVLLGNYPLFWVREPAYVLLVVAVSVATLSIGKLMKYFRQLYLIFDAIGLVVFSIMGAQVALSMKTGVIVACVAAVATGVAGGILRDLLCDRVPLVFQEGETLYASVSLLVCLVYVGLGASGMSQNAAVTLTVAFGIALRIAALRYRIKLPVFEYEETYYDNRKAVRRMLQELRQRWVRKEAVGDTLKAGTPDVL